MRIVVQTGSEDARRLRHEEPRLVPTVEIWIGGLRFVHRCTTPEEARKIALAVIFDLDIGHGE